MPGPLRALILLVWAGAAQAGGDCDATLAAMETAGPATWQATVIHSTVRKGPVQLPGPSGTQEPVELVIGRRGGGSLTIKGIGIALASASPDAPSPAADYIQSLVSPATGACVLSGVKALDQGGFNRVDLILQLPQGAFAVQTIELPDGDGPPTRITSTLELLRLQAKP